MRASYTLQNGKLLIQEQPTQRTLWEGWIESVPVTNVVPLSNEDGCLVLLDYHVAKKQTFENLLKIDRDGKIIWRAQLPESHNFFVAIRYSDDKLEANTWSGHLLEVDLQTGHAKNIRFTK
jgi:hypothetical protein